MYHYGKILKNQFSVVVSNETLFEKLSIFIQQRRFVLNASKEKKEKMIHGGPKSYVTLTDIPGHPHILPIFGLDMRLD